MELKVRGVIFKVVGFAILAFGACVFGSQYSFAASSLFEITNVEVSQKSDTATGDVTSVVENEIRNNIVFRKVGDSVTYRVTLKNIGASEKTIDSISSDCSSELFVCELDVETGETIAVGGVYDFDIKTTYKNAVSDMSERQQDFAIRVIVKFTDSSEEEIIINPTTEDNILSFVAIFAIGAVVLIGIFILRAKKPYIGNRIVVLVVLFAVACCFAPFVKASDGVYDAIITNTITMNDKLVVRYLSKDSSTELKNETVAYGGYSQAPIAPDVEGYYFDGWVTEQGDVYDYATTPVTEDLVLSAKYIPYTYTIHFDGNGALDGSVADQAMTYDVAAELNANNYVRIGYDFVGWNTAADGSGDDYADHESVKNLRNEPGVCNLFAIWQARNDTRYTVVDMFMTVNGDDYESITRPSDETIGTTDTNVTPAPLSRDGFEMPEAQTKKITGDGSMRIEYVYARVKKKLTIQDAQYVVSSHVSGEYNYGTLITLEAKEREGWVFENWSNGDTDTEIEVVLNSDMIIGPVYRKHEFALAFSHEGACTFNGLMESKSSNNNHGLMDAGYITGEECAEYADQKYIDTGVQLFSSENAHKDFYVEFTIEEFELSKNAGRATFLNSTQEKPSTSYPGIVVRRDDRNDKLVIGVNVVKDGVKTVDSKTYFNPISSVNRIRIVRKNDAICYAVNNDDYVYVGDNTPFNQYFSSPSVMFGASIDGNTAGAPLFRYLNGTLSGMKIFLGEDVDDTINCTHQ